MTMQQAIKYMSKILESTANSITRNMDHIGSLKSTQM